MQWHLTKGLPFILQLLLLAVDTRCCGMASAKSTRSTGTP
jgi:hypothetical protein